MARTRWCEDSAKRVICDGGVKILRKAFGCDTGHRHRMSQPLRLRNPRCTRKWLASGIKYDFHPAVLLFAPRSGGRMLGAPAELRAGAVEPGDALGHFLLADNERRQQAHDIVAGADRQHLLCSDRIDEFAGWYNRPQAHE